jgi:hypothetical protein
VVAALAMAAGSALRLAPSRLYEYRGGCASPLSREAAATQIRLQRLLLMMLLLLLLLMLLLHSPAVGTRAEAIFSIRDVPRPGR